MGGGMCRPCREFCRGNSDICLSKDEYNKAMANPKDYPLDRASVSSVPMISSSCRIVLVVVKEVVV